MEDLTLSVMVNWETQEIVRLDKHGMHKGQELRLLPAYDKNWVSITFQLPAHVGGHLITSWDDLLRTELHRNQTIVSGDEVIRRFRGVL